MKEPGRCLLISGIVILIAMASSMAQTQGELNEDACAKYKKADTQMNTAYKQILEKYKSDAVFIEKLRTAQRLWVQFRDAHLESLYPDPNTLQAYGSVNPMCRCQALGELTKERTKQLKQWVDGVEEGEVCAGSIRIKQ